MDGKTSQEPEERKVRGVGNRKRPCPGRRRLIGVALALAAMAMVVAATAVVAQTGGGFDLTWSSIDGGGTTSNGGAFELLGVAGQPDAGVLTGGAFELEGGFLNYDTAQVPVELSGFAIE